MIVAIVVVVLLAVLALMGVVMYNRFVRQRQFIDNAWSNVETELRRRYDLIPNLVETVKGYAAHERETLDAVVAARAAAASDEGSPTHQSTTENALVSALQSLLAVSEAYPDLKANTSFLDLQRQLVTTEDRIQAARRFYNNNVRAYNERVQSVPAAIVAKSFGFTARSYFDIDAAVHTSGAPDVSFGGTDRS